MKDQNGWKWTFLVAGGHFWNDFYVNFLPPILPLVSGLWGLTNAQIGLFVSVQSVTSNFFQPALGYLLDKNPRRGGASLALSIAVIALPMSFIYLADNYLTFMAMVTFAGLGSALYHPLGASRSIDGAGPDKALKMSVFSCLGTLGFAISPAITAYIISLWGLEGLKYMVFPGLLWIALLYLAGRRRTVEMTQVQTETAAKLDGPVYKNLVLLSGVVAARSWVATACTIFFPIWMTAQGIGDRQAGLYLTDFLLAGALGGFLSGYIYPRLGQKKIIIGSFAVSILLLPLVFLAGHGLLLGLVIFLYGFFLQGSYPVTVVMGQEMLPARAGLASGMTMGFAFGMGGLGTTVTGLLADHLGVVTALNVTSLLLIPACVIVYFLKKPLAVAENP